jgi:hypothetical protein
MRLQEDLGKSLLSIVAAGIGGCATRAPPAAPAADAPLPTVAAKSAEPAAPSAPAAPTEAPAVEPPPLPRVELVQVDHAPAPASMPSLTIVAPTKGQVLDASKAAATVVKLRLAGWPLDRDGNHVCVALDRHPCRKVTDLRAPLTLKDLDPAIDEGQHVLSVFARRGSNESVKPAGKRAAFASTSFFVGKRGAPVWKDGGPMLFLSFPEDGPAPAEGPLVDVFVANADFASGRYRVHVAVAGPGVDAGTAVSVDSLKPWRLHHARPGEYLVRFSLFQYEADQLKSGSATEVAYASKPVPGPFAEVTRTFQVKGR